MLNTLTYYYSYYYFYPRIALLSVELAVMYARYARLLADELTA